MINFLKDTMYYILKQLNPLYKIVQRGIIKYKYFIQELQEFILL